MAKHIDLNRDALRAYRDGRSRDAALLWLKAAEAARALKDGTAWYKYRVWAANSFHQADENARAMDMLMEARLHEPPDRPDLEAWIAREDLIEITLNTHPDLTRLTAFLNELKAMATRQNAPAGDVPLLEGRILQGQGRHAEALASYERAWQVYDGRGYIKYNHASWAARCCLALARPAAARDWLAASRATNEDFQGRLVDETAIELRLGLFHALTDAGTARLPALLRRLRDAAEGMQDHATQDLLSELGARVALLDPANGDPMAHDHPARRLLTRRLANARNVPGEYGRRALLVDFRLAALRFLVGMPPAEDYYYRQPHRLPASPPEIDMGEFRYRRQRALAACRRAEVYGKRIDGLLKCGWRQKSVNKRRARIGEIARLYGFEPTDP